MKELEADFASTVLQERSRLGSEKKKQKDTARLVWASKSRKEPSPKDLVFQTSEIVYPNKATGNLTSFFEKNKQDISKNPNRLIWGDNLLVMQALLARGYEGKIDLIYIDPPFNTGENFNFSDKVQIGQKEFEKDLPLSERLAYTDMWERGLDSFLDMLYPRLQLMRRLLSDQGSLYLHLDENAVHYVKVLLDEIFGRDRLVNEIVWRRGSPHGDAKRFGANHDTILFYSKTQNYLFNKLFLDHTEESTSLFNKSDRAGRYKLISCKAPGKRGPYYEWKGVTDYWRYSQESMAQLDREGKLEYSSSGTPYKKGYLHESKGLPIQSFWGDIVNVRPGSEILGYPTQKPEALLQRIIESSSNENQLIADFFCGSGTTAAIAERLGRQWISSDLSKTAIQVARSRLVSQEAQPFVIENLGNYQRQLIYLHEVKFKEMYDIILNLYGAVPRIDKQGVGVSNTDRSTLVYVCEPDRPMTARKAVELAKEAANLDGRGYKHLVILAWDYDYNYDEDLKRFTKSGGKLANIESKIIPSDVYKYLRSTKVGDPTLSEKITFYQKPYVKVSEPKVISKDGEEQIVKLQIEQYVIMDNPIRDEEKRHEVETLLRKNYAYLIDFWSVDSDYDNETFRSRWQAIRDKKSREPVVTSADFRLKKGKKYKIAVRVVDVFGNDASAVKEIDLR